MLGREADNLVGNSSDNRQQSDARGEARPERGEWDQHVENERDQNDPHQETGAAPRMIGRIFLHCHGVERVSVFEGKDGFVLGTVILVDTANILPERYSPNEEQEQYEADTTIDQVENNSAAQSGINFLEFGRSQEGNVFVHEDEESQ